MTLTELSSLISGTSRPQLAMSIIFAIADRHDAGDDMVEKEAVCDLITGGEEVKVSLRSNVTKTVAELPDVITARYQDKEGNFHDQRSGRLKAFYELKPKILTALGR